jgi:ATP/ADP translocase
MATALWIIQIILGIKLLSVSYTHGLRQSQPTMQDAIRRMGRLARPLHHAIAFAAFVGAMGLTLPGILRSSTWITPITAILLSILLLSSIFFHIRSREKPNVFVSVILFAFAVFIAFGRWGFTP